MKKILIEIGYTILNSFMISIGIFGPVIGATLGGLLIAWIFK